MAEPVNILIVDDAEINREMLKLMLTGDDVSFAEAQDGAQAIQLIEQAETPFDLLLLDINMPNVDGFGVLQHIHDHRLAEGMPIIMISAENAADFMDRAYDLGATDYIPRPFDAAVVQRRVRNTLELFHKQRAIAEQLREANMRYMDTVKRMRADIVLYIHLDLDSDSYRSIEDTQRYLQHFELDGTIDDMVSKLFQMIPEPELSTRAMELFSRESLIRSHESGQDTVALEHDFITSDSRRLKLATTAGIVSNPITGDLEAIIYSVDISRAYIKRRMQNLLYEDVFDGIGMINTRTQSIATYDISDTPAMVAFEKRYGGKNYDECIAKGTREVILEQDSVFFKENACLQNVQRELETKDIFTFVVGVKTTEGKKNRYSFRYLDDSHEVIVMTVEDCTKNIETDILTGGHNRAGFENAVGFELASDDVNPASYAVLFVNIRGFKAVNDLFGREGGDMALRKFAKHLAESSVKPIALGRADSDMFLCLAKTDNLTDEKLRSALTATIELASKKSIEVRARCGIYSIKGNEDSISSMCDYAAMAIDGIENEFATPYAFFNEKMRNTYLNHEYLMGHLDDAIDNGEFIPYYQPIVDSKTHELVSAEALVRWKSPELGMVSPASFIPALEGNGQISRVDLLISRSVQHMLEERHSAGKRIVPVSTNLSRMDFYDREMMAALFEDVADAKVPTEYLRKELTESSYVRFAETQGRVLTRLNELGIPLLLDDFGTGASSFGSIRDFTFSIIKLDMSFVRAIGRDEKGDTLLYSLIRLAHGLGLKTVAEGVETDEQLAFLTDCECDYIQGYYFSRPLPEAEFVALLDAEHIDWSEV